MTNASDRSAAFDAAARTALVLIAVFALARLALVATFGLGFDEAYTIVISRRLDLSYFDHPPLHQWIAHFTALALGEGRPTRLPFVALFAGTGWLTFALTRRLFGARAGLVALVALNLSAFFFASPGGWVMPDGPLLLALAGAALTLAALFFGAPSERAVWGLWLGAGVWLGLAGLSKYSAALFVAGLVVFLLLSPRQRRWFAHPAPYAAALVALAIVSPVIVWNWRHEWVSFAFQSERGSLEGGLRPVQVLAQILGEIALLTPWIFVPLFRSLVDGARRAVDDEKRLFLACLALPAIVLFTLTPLWGARGLPHWPMPGWFFAFPLLGAWCDERAAAGYDFRRRAIVWAGLLAAVAILVVSQAATGWTTRLFPLPKGAVDPTLEMLDWGALRAGPGLDQAAYVVATKWVEAGKIGLALGPGKPIFVFSHDPRGMALLDDSARVVGQDGIIVVPMQRLDKTLEELGPYFTRLDPPRTLVLQRAGRDEIPLALIPAHGLTRAFPVPYRH